MKPYTFEQYIFSQDKQRVMQLYREHSPIVADILTQVHQFFITHNIERQIFVNPDERFTIADVHYLFRNRVPTPVKDMVTMLFWYFLYKTPEYQIYTGVSYDSGYNTYILLVNEVGDTKCSLGFDMKYLDYYYRTIERKLKKFTPHTEDYFFGLLNSIDEMFDDNGNLIILN